MESTVEMDSPADQSNPVPQRDMSGEWFAIHTRPRHEKSVASQLSEKNINTFLPVLQQKHQWSDRRKLVEVPLFSCYVFVQVPGWRSAFHRVVRTPGVLQWLGFGGQPSPIAAYEIDGIRSMVSQGLPIARHAYLKAGQRVRLRSGCLDGLEGIVVGHKGDRKLVVSINLIQQSAAVSIEGYEVEEIP